MFYRILGKMLPFLLNSFIQLLHTMNMIPLPNKSRSLIALSLKWLALAAVMLLAPQTFASHYRGAAASYTIDSSGLVTVTAYTAWRTASGISELVSFRVYTGSGATGTLMGTMTQNTGATVNPFTSGTEFGGSPYFVKKEVFTFSLSGQANGIYYAWWGSSAWVAGIQNAVDQNSWSVQLKIAYTAGVASAGPTMLPATIDIIGRGNAYTQNLNSIDPDGTPVVYSNLLGSGSPHYAPLTTIPGMSLSSIGGISIPGGTGAGTTSALNLGRYGYKIEVTDGSGGSAIRDVLVVVADPTGGSANNPPVLGAIGPKTINVGNNLSFVVTGTDPDAAWASG